RGGRRGAGDPGRWLTPGKLEGQRRPEALPIGAGLLVGWRRDHVDAVEHPRPRLVEPERGAAALVEGPLEPLRRIGALAGGDRGARGRAVEETLDAKLASRVHRIGIALGDDLQGETQCPVALRGALRADRCTGFARLDDRLGAAGIDLAARVRALAALRPQLG